MPNLRRNTKTFSNVINTTDVMNAVGKSVKTQMGRSFQRWAKAVEEGVIEARNKEMGKINRRVAEEARSAIFQAYSESGIGLGAAYRWNDVGRNKRYSHGAMKRAMKSRNLVIGDDRGIGFVDVNYLDRVAKQWYRLNFGALPKGSGGRGPAEGSMKLFGKTLSGRLTLNGFGPSEPFKVPQQGLGTWSSVPSGSSTSKPLKPAPRGSRNGYLYLYRSGGEQKTRVKKGMSMEYFMSVPASGIKGKHFLEAGTKVINTRYPKELETLIRTWEEKGARAV